MSEEKLFAELCKDLRDLGATRIHFSKWRIAEGVEIVFHDEPKPIKIPLGSFQCSKETLEKMNEQDRPAAKNTSPAKQIDLESLLKTPFDDLSDKDVLYYATPHFDELQADKEAHAKKLIEERDKKSV